MRGGRPAIDPAPTLREDLGVALAAADAAAAVTLAWFGDRLPVELKADDTPVTAVDRAAERAIRSVLADRAPGDGILGEEGGHARRQRPDLGDRPSTARSSTGKGIPLWTHADRAADRRSLVLGVADAPALSVRYQAARGGGAWRGDRRLRVSAIDTLTEAFIGHSPLEEWAGSGDERHLVRLAGRVRRTRGLSDAWAHLLVAQGSMEELVEHEPCFPWDWAATEVIVEEAGGRITTLTGAQPAPGGHPVGIERARARRS